MDTRRLLASPLALVVTGVLAFAGCGDPKEPVVRTKANRDRTIQAGDIYVALGDSYTAAHLTGEDAPDSGPCLRSLSNYPNLVADELGLRLTDVSCGGATSGDVLSPQQLSTSTVPAQIEAVTEDTDLVTISVGANDIDLYGVIIGTCVKLAAQEPDGSPCADLAGNDTETADRKLAVVSDTLSSAIRTIVAKAPRARVIVVGYPQTYPTARPCPDLPIAKGDVPFARSAAQRVTDMLRSTAEEMKVDYIDVWAATEGHDICSDDPWVAGAQPKRTDGAAYHPFPEEQRAIADLLTAALSAPATD